jgi:hypothetical protein
MIWMMELLHNYSYKTMAQENSEKITNSIKENRLLYELGEITSEEYATAVEKLNHQRKILHQEKGINLNYRVNMLGG